MQRLEPLRKCRFCGLEANSETDLEKFHKSKASRFGYENFCKQCWNSQQSKGGKYWASTVRSNKTIHLKRITFLGKRISLKENPRTNICSMCGKHYPEELKQQTSIHHIIYDNLNQLNGILELCHSCHTKVHWAKNNVSDDEYVKIPKEGWQRIKVLIENFPLEFQWDVQNEPDSDERHREIMPNATLEKNRANAVIHKDEILDWYAELVRLLK